MKSFHTELRDLYSGDLYTRATVFYEGDVICGLEDEFGKVWSPRELTIHDLQLIEKHLVQNLLADQASSLERSEYENRVC